MTAKRCRAPLHRRFHRSLRRLLALVLGCVVAAAPVCASAEQARTLPPEVRAYFDKARQECREAGDRLRVQDETSFAETADFNGDGHPDYIVHLASLVCPSLGYSEYCGSAGCMIAILVSQGDRLREVASDNYQELAITSPVAGKQNIAFAAHGTFCGHETGADTCFGVMSWTPKGFRTTYTKVVPPALEAQMAATAAPEIRPDRNPRYDWKLIQPPAGKKGPSIAMSDGTPDQTKTVVACVERLPVLIVAFPPGPNAPPAGVPVMIEIGEPQSSQAQAELVLQPVQDKTAYVGQLSRTALTIMLNASDQDYAAVPQAWTIANRDYWIEMPALPLRHFRAAASAVLAGCANRAR